MDNFSAGNSHIDLVQDSLIEQTHDRANSNGSEHNHELSPRFKRYEERMKKKPLEFVGYRHYKPKTIVLPDGTVQEIPEMSNELKKCIYEAVVRGDIVQVDTLLSLPGSDINMTWFSENLLMCAIRNKQEKIAEHLINSGIDVTYESELVELTDKLPINYYKYSCRQMAYDYGLNRIVDLIDIFNKSTNKHIVKFLGKRILNESNHLSDIENAEMYKNRIRVSFDDKKSDKSSVEEKKSEKSKASSVQLISDSFTLQNEIERDKPNSDLMFTFRQTDNFDFDEESKVFNEVHSISTRSLLARKEPMLNPLNKEKPDIKMDLKENVAKIVSQSEELLNQPNANRKKSLKYNGYKLNLFITDSNENCLEDSKLFNDTPRDSSRTSSFRLSSRLSINSSQTFYANQIESVEKPKQPIIPKLKKIIPENKISYKENQKYFVKKDTANIVELKSNQTNKSKYYLNKFNNYYYLNSLSSRDSEKKNMINENLLKHNELLFPLYDKNSSQNASKNKLSMGLKNKNISTSIMSNNEKSERNCAKRVMFADEQGDFFNTHSALSFYSMQRKNLS